MGDAAARATRAKPPLPPPLATATTSMAAVAPPLASTHERRLLKQASVAWLLKRWLILNIDLMTGTLLFAAAVASPGALSMGLLTAAVVAMQAAVWRVAASVMRRPVTLPWVRISDTSIAVGYFALAQVVLAVAMLALYGLQLAQVAAWVRLMSTDGGGGSGRSRPWSPAAVLDWLGLPLCGSPPPPPPPPLQPPLVPPLPPANLLSADAVAVAAMTWVVAGSGGADAAGLLRQRGLMSTMLSAAMTALGLDEPTDSGACAPAPGLRLRLGLGLLALAALALRSKQVSGRLWSDCMC